MEYLQNGLAKCHDFFWGWKMAICLWFYVVFITIKMVFSEKFPKNCVFEVFYCFCKNDHLISKTGLGPYFSLPNQPIVWILWRMARQFGQNPDLKLLLWTANKNGQLRCNGDLCLQQRQIRLQRDSPSLCIISLRSVQFLLSAARCPSGNWNTFATEKITLQLWNWLINVLEVYSVGGKNHCIVAILYSVNERKKWRWTLR